MLSGPLVFSDLLVFSDVYVLSGPLVFSGLLVFSDV